MRYSLFTIIFFAFSCSSTSNLAKSSAEKTTSELPGVYKGKIKGLNDLYNLYTLTINSDGTFYYEIKAFESNPKCSGKWKLAKYDSLLCECDEEKDISVVLSNGYMNQRKTFFRVLPQGLLRLDDILLWKQTN